MFNFVIYKIGQFFALNLPLKVGYTLAIFISDIRSFFAFTDRRDVTGNLKAIFPDKTKKEIAKIRRRLFRNFAKYLVDFFRFSILDKEYIHKNIKIENLHYYQEELKKALTLSPIIDFIELTGILAKQPSKTSFIAMVSKASCCNTEFAAAEI